MLFSRCRTQQPGLWLGELVALVLCLLMPALAFSTTYYVTKTGNDTTGTGAVGAP